MTNGRRGAPLFLRASSPSQAEKTVIMSRKVHRTSPPKASPACDENNTKEARQTWEGREEYERVYLTLNFLPSFLPQAPSRKNTCWGGAENARISRIRKACTRCSYMSTDVHKRTKEKKRVLKGAGCSHYCCLCSPLLLCGSILSRRNTHKNKILRSKFPHLQ